jgi:hypothetical protein
VRAFEGGHEGLELGGVPATQRVYKVAVKAEFEGGDEADVSGESQDVQHVQDVQVNINMFRMFMAGYSTRCP